VLYSSSETPVRDDLAPYPERAFCFHTKQELRPFVIIDIGYAAVLASISIWNRFDGCFDRAKSLAVSLGMKDDNMRIVYRRADDDVRVADEGFDEGRGPIRLTFESPEIARYIMFWLDGENFLHLGGIEVSAVRPWL
jgi:hypothetical protein